MHTGVSNCSKGDLLGGKRGLTLTTEHVEILNTAQLQGSTTLELVVQVYSWLLQVVQGSRFPLAAAGDAGHHSGNGFRFPPGCCR